MVMDRKTIERNFKYHPPIQNQNLVYEEIRAKAKEMALLINNLCPESREKYIAITKLEESVMWANASVARYSHE